MKRLLMLSFVCTSLGLAGIPGSFAQKGNVIAPKPKEIPGVIADLKSTEKAKRLNAAKLLGAAAQIRAKDIQEAVPLLLETVKSDTEADVRREAGRTLALGNPDSKLAVPVLIAVLKDDKDFQVKAAAAGALGSMGPAAKDAVSALSEAAEMGKSAGKDERDKQALGKAAATALKQIGK